ncbi:hypothetical protein Tco_1456250 [Tanacetum coccineum]
MVRHRIANMYRRPCGGVGLCMRVIVLAGCGGGRAPIYGNDPLRLKVCLKSEMGHVYKLGRDVEKLVDVVYKLGSSFGLPAWPCWFVRWGRVVVTFLVGVEQGEVWECGTNGPSKYIVELQGWSFVVDSTLGDGRNAPSKLYEVLQRPYLDKECPLSEEVKQVDEVNYGEFERLAPFNGNNGAKFRVGPPGYYTRTDNHTLFGEKRPNLVETINKYMEGAAKRQAE